MKTLLAIVAALISINFAEVEAKPYSVLELQQSGNDQIKIDRSETTLMQISCFGCISPETGRMRNNYVRPHYNNGRFVGGYWRS